MSNFDFDDTDVYYPKKKFDGKADDRRYPPRRKSEGAPKGADYFTLTEAHGRPHGVFEHGRQLPYRGNKA